MTIYGISEILMADKLNMNAPKTRTKSGRFYPFSVLFGTFRETRSLKFGKKIGRNLAKKLLYTSKYKKKSEALPPSLLYLICH